MYPKLNSHSKTISPGGARGAMATNELHPQLSRDQSSPDRLLKIQRKVQLRNAIIDRFKAKHLRR